MNRGRKIRWMMAAVLFIFACSPAAVPAALPTLGPDQINTAIAGTAGAAFASTGNPQVAQPAGPVLDAPLNTAVAGTAAAAATRTAALIPPTLTPSVTPLPSKTPTLTPIPTQTFIFLLPTRTRTPRPPTPRPSSGGGGGGGGGGVTESYYGCTKISVSPANGTEFAPNAPFQTVWRVKNTGDTWLRTSADLVYISGNTFSAVDRVDFTATVDPGETVNLPAVDMQAPGAAGSYSTSWSLQVGHDLFCSLSLSITVN